jgi:hypothetical protein
MKPRTDYRIEAGQDIGSAISATAWNRAQEAADVVLGATPAISATGTSYRSSPYIWVHAKNDSGGDVPRWGVLSIDDMFVTPTSDSYSAATKQFESQPVIKATTAAGVLAKESCVAIEPIASGAIGRVAVSGAVQVRAADIAKVRGAIILWKNDDWAIVRFGDRDPVRLCKTSSVWNRDTIAQLNVWEDGGPPAETQSTGQTIHAVNKMHKVASGTWVIVARAVNGTYYLVEAGDNQSESCASPSIAGRDLTELPGYDAAKKQALTHDNGCLKWIDLADCPA